MILIGLVGAGGLALIADRTFVSSATAQVKGQIGEQIGGLTNLVADAQHAGSIAQTLNSGDPVQIQDLLENLISEEGATPENTRPGLFQTPEAAATKAGKPEGEPAQPITAKTAADSTTDAVSMIITTPNGGLAVINGTPMRAGDTADGCTLLAVHPDRVVIERGPDRRVLRLPTPGNP